MSNKHMEWTLSPSESRAVSAGAQNLAIVRHANRAVEIGDDTLTEWRSLKDSRGAKSGQRVIEEPIRTAILQRNSGRVRGHVVFGETFCGLI